MTFPQQTRTHLRTLLLLSTGSARGRRMSGLYFVLLVLFLLLPSLSLFDGVGVDPRLVFAMEAGGIVLMVVGFESIHLERQVGSMLLPISGPTRTSAAALLMIGLPTVVVAGIGLLLPGLVDWKTFLPFVAVVMAATALTGLQVHRVRKAACASIAVAGLILLLVSEGIVLSAAGGAMVAMGAVPGLFASTARPAPRGLWFLGPTIRHRTGLPPMERLHLDFRSGARRAVLWTVLLTSTAWGVLVLFTQTEPSPLVEGTLSFLPLWPLLLTLMRPLGMSALAVPWGSAPWALLPVPRDAARQRIGWHVGLVCAASGLVSAGMFAGLVLLGQPLPLGAPSLLMFITLPGVAAVGFAPRLIGIQGSRYLWIALGVFLATVVVPTGLAFGAAYRKPLLQVVTGLGWLGGLLLLMLWLVRRAR